MLPISDAFQGEVLSILSDLTGLPDLQNFLDLNLFDEGLLDSLTLVRLLVELSSHFSIHLTPADVQRDEWSTPRGILKAVESHLAA